MSSKFLFSSFAISLVCMTAPSVAAEAEKEVMGHIMEEWGKVLKERREASEKTASAVDPVADASPESKKEELAVRTVKEEAGSAKKKKKAHFIGSKKPVDSSIDKEGKEKKSSRLRNEWVVSKTYPKAKKKAEITQEEAVSQVANAPVQPVLFGTRPPQEESSPAVKAMQKKIDSLQKQLDVLKEETGESQLAPLKAPDGHVFLVGEWLFWRTRETGTEFAVTHATPSVGILSNAAAHTVEVPWQSGFRVGLGVHLPNDGWDIALGYTHFMPSHARTVTGSIFPLLIAQSFPVISNVSQALGHWGMLFQIADIAIGRAYPVTPTLAFKPFIGMKGAWIKQRFHCVYTGGDIPDGLQYTIHNEMDFKGVGGQIGIESNWNLGVGLSFFGNASTALMAGYFDLSQKQMTPADISEIDLGSKVNYLNPMAQLVLGIAWDRNFYRDRCHFGVYAGFESQYWWDQNQAALFTDTDEPIYVRPSSDLGLYGLTLGMRLDF